MFRKILRYTIRFILGFILFVLIYLGLALTLPYLKTNTSYASCQKGIEVFIKSNGVHTDFILPVNESRFDWRKKIPYSDFEKADSTFGYICLGWGNKGFYLDTPTWADLKASTVFKAAFGIGSTAMHVTYRHYAPQEDELCKRLILSEKEYTLLIAYIYSSFKIENGKPIAIMHPGYSEYDCFYEGSGTYTLFKTCNVWTGDGLKFIGVKIGVWTPLHKGVIDHCQNTN